MAAGLAHGHKGAAHLPSAFADGSGIPDGPGVSATSGCSAEN